MQQIEKKTITIIVIIIVKILLILLTIPNTTDYDYIKTNTPAGQMLF